MYKLAPVDIVMGILGFSNSKKLLISDTYDTFCKICENNAILRNKLNNPYFSKYGNQFYSKELEEMLFQMGTSKTLEIIHVTYYVSRKESIRNYLMNVLSKEDLLWIIEMAKDFDKHQNTQIEAIIC